MLNPWRWALFFGLATLICGQTATFAETASLALRSQSSLVHLVRKSVIDKSCIMMCDKWGDNGCEKWVMRCKGDPGYPKGMSTVQ